MSYKHVKDFRSRRRVKIKDYLGGRCAECGKVEGLEVDHIDASQKSFDPSNYLTLAWEKLRLELDKCQLLCKECHLIKTKREGDNTGGGHNKILNPQHGTSVMYHSHRCRCDECRLWQMGHRRGLVDNYGNVMPGKDLSELSIKDTRQSEIKHGTYAGYQKERRLKLEVCPECRAAGNRYMRELHRSRKQ